MSRETPFVGLPFPLSVAPSITEPTARRAVEPLADDTRSHPAASFRADCDDAARTVCAHCGHPHQQWRATLGVTIAPSTDDAQALLVRPGASLSSVLDDARRALMRDALARAGGVQSRAARLLGMKYTTFHALARRLGLTQGRRRKQSSRVAAAPLELVAERDASAPRASGVDAQGSPGNSTQR